MGPPTPRNGYAGRCTAWQAGKLGNLRIALMEIGPRHGAGMGGMACSGSSSHCHRQMPAHLRLPPPAVLPHFSTAMFLHLTVTHTACKKPATIAGKGRQVKQGGAPKLGK
jgi:hypothetical protein